MEVGKVRLVMTMVWWYLRGLTPIWVNSTKTVLGGKRSLFVPPSVCWSDLRMGQLENVQEDQWYMLHDVTKVIKEFIRICQGLQESRKKMSTLLHCDQPACEPLKKPLVTLNYLVTRIEADTVKLVYFVRQLILMFDNGMRLMYIRLKEEHTAVGDMINEMTMNAGQPSLTHSTRSLEKKREETRKQYGAPTLEMRHEILKWLQFTCICCVKEDWRIRPKYCGTGLLAAWLRDYYRKSRILFSGQPV